MSSAKNNDYFNPGRRCRDSILPVSYSLNENDTVHSDSCREIVLTKEIGCGHEGTIFQTNTPYVAKIFKAECCTSYRLEKILQMIGNNLKHDGICFPVSVLYNHLGQFVGYLMPYARGISITNSIFKQSFFQNAIPSWNRIDLVRVCINILKKIEFLHKQKILVGDISPNNILVTSPSDVLFVDTDSFQIGDLPCPAGMTAFTAPEIYNMQRCGLITAFSDFLRTYEQEYFAVATLLFMILLPGKAPYDCGAKGEMAENILKMKFPYELSPLGRDLKHLNIWQIIWSHLTNQIKYDFCLVFQKSDEKSQFNIKERLSVSQWIDELTEYCDVLQKREIELSENISSITFDPQSLLIYPYHFHGD